MEEAKINMFLESLDGITNIQWDAAKEIVDREFRRLKNKNALDVSESVLKKNLISDLHLQED